MINLRVPNDGPHSAHALSGTRAEGLAAEGVDVRGRPATRWHRASHRGDGVTRLAEGDACVLHRERYTERSEVMFKKLCVIILPVLAVCVFLLPFLIGSIAKGQNGKVIEIEIGKPQTAKAAIKIAYTKHFDEEDIASAITAYQRVISDFPESKEAAEAQFRIANVYHWNTVEPEKAIAEYQKVIDNYPNTDYAIESLIRTGEAYGQLKQYNQAQEFFQQVIDKYPDTPYAPWAMLSLGNLIYFDLFDPLRAKPIYQEFLAKYPNTEYAAEAKLWVTRIGVEREGFPAEKAIEIYRQMIASNPQFYHVQAAAQYTIGYTYLTKGKNQQALTEFQKVLENYPDTHKDWLALTFNFMGHAYINLGKLPEAEAKFNQGIVDYPNNLWQEDLRKQLQIVKSLRAIATIH